MRALYLTLDRGGDGARGSIWDDEKRIDARRAGKLLEMKIRDEDGDIVDLTLPWSLARCVLGGENLTRKEIDRAMAAGTFSIRVQDDDIERPHLAALKRRPRPTGPPRRSGGVPRFPARLRRIFTTAPATPAERTMR